MFAGFSDKEISGDKATVKKYKKQQQLLKQNPFVTTGLNLEQEQELLDASDEISVSSEEPPEPLPPPIAIDSSYSFPRRSLDPLTVIKAERASSDSGVSSGTASPPSAITEVCPRYKLVAGTTFAVDALRYSLTTGVTHLFVTHFREGHRVGGDRTGPTLVMTQITADRMGLGERNLRLVELNKPIVINGIRVTALDANRPGSVMFLFCFPSGLNVLYVGDQSRPTPLMEEQPSFWNINVHVLYINTSYLSNKFSFQEQWQAVTDSSELVRANSVPTHQLLLICGTNFESKSKLVLKNLAKELKANVRVVSNGLRYDQLIPYLDDLPTTYNVVLALRPATPSAGPPPQLIRDTQTAVPEISPHWHQETRRFVRFLQPLEIVSTGDTHLRSSSGTPESVGSLWPKEVTPGTVSVTAFVRRMGACCTFCDRLHRGEGCTM